MNTKQIFATATVVSMLACAMPAGAQVLGGSLGGSLGGTLTGGLGGLGGLGGPTSVATGTLRDVNGMARSTTSHAHDQVDAAVTNADRAVGRVDEQTRVVSAAADAATSTAANGAANAATSAASRAETGATQSGEIAKPAAKSVTQSAAKPAKQSTERPAEHAPSSPTRWCLDVGSGLLRPPTRMPRWSAERRLRRGSSLRLWRRASRPAYLYAT